MYWIAHPPDPDESGSQHGRPFAVGAEENERISEGDDRLPFGWPGNHRFGGLAVVPVRHVVSGPGEGDLSLSPVIGGDAGVQQDWAGLIDDARAGPAADLAGFGRERDLDFCPPDQVR